MDGNLMELINRLLLANDRVSELTYKINRLEEVLHDEQEREAELRVKYRQKEEWNLSGATVYVSEIAKIFGFQDSETAVQIIERAKEEENDHS